MASLTKPRPSISGPSTINGSVARPPLPSRASSLANAVSASARQEDYVNPDDLFTKHTVAEVRAVQRRLRIDADGKQEELRLMVGERYRDLLQASASIISIAQSSSNVLDALEDMKATVRDRTQLRIHKRTASSKLDDTRLRALQSLAAHVKLLLDTPEHLWRLLERKRYLHAAWLFLLARVIHRSLASEDIDEDDGWQNQGIETLDHFPLAQKQWDTIAHFRPQITHKATLYLRETNQSTEDICATVLTLHLTDSRPLTETLSVFLAQRSKALDALLSRKPEEVASTKTVGTDPSLPAQTQKARLRTRKTIAREVWQVMEAVLNTVFGTIGAARDVFQDRSPEQQSLVRRVLDYITKDETSAFAGNLPPDLRLSTQRFLTALPSSSHFLLLPASLRQYKPYVDLSSTSTIVAQLDLSRKLEEWFRTSAQRLKVTLNVWFAELESVRQVWAVRRWARDVLQDSSHLEDHEKAHIESVLDEACKARVVEIWTSVLEDTEQSFRSALRQAIDDLSHPFKPPKVDSSDVSPIQYLLQSTTQTISTFSSLDATSVYSLGNFATQLRRQLNGQTPLLSQVLSPLESRAERLQRDLRFIDGGHEETSSIPVDILDHYLADADSFCKRISSTLAAEADQALNSSSDTSLPVIVFIGRVADELASHSQFTLTIGMRAASLEAFRESVRRLHSRAVSTWQDQTLSNIVAEYLSASHRASVGLSVFPGPDLLDVSRPSPPLVQALLSLSTAIQELGLQRDALQRQAVVESTIQIFVDKFVETRYDGASKSRGMQMLSDLFFLRSIADQWSPALPHAQQALDSPISTLHQQLSADETQLPTRDGSAEHLARTQLILDVLFPAKTANVIGTSTTSAPLLRLGAANTTEQFSSAMDVVKPAARFGLLMVADTGL